MCYLGMVAPLLKEEHYCIVHMVTGHCMSNTIRGNNFKIGVKALNGLYCREALNRAFFYAKNCISYSVLLYITFKTGSGSEVAKSIISMVRNLLKWF
jgi:hypothetical protein